ncbi:hypothetical protein OG21DRAFT_818280 [Imleria badia]|nr:hypothetical protein OG21DRAFT_818280 [Imleria badia]
MGIYDAEDRKPAPSILAAEPHVYMHKKRVAIQGGSAGAPMLASLTIAPDTTYYKPEVVTSAYGGIPDLTRLTQITERFELQYVYNLLGGSPGQIPDVYTEQSPNDNVSNPEIGKPNISRPLLILQDEKDGVVPPLQAHLLLEKIAKEASEGHIAWKFSPWEGHH